MMPTLLSLEALEADRLYVERQLREAATDQWGTARHMWHTRLKEIDERIDKLSNTLSNYASVAIIFDGNPVIASTDIRLDFAADVLERYQRVISLALASKLSQELPQRGPLPGADQSRLFIRDLVRGSVGFILEEIATEQEEMLPTPLKAAVEDSTRLISTFNTATDEEFEETLETTEPRLVNAIQKFCRILYESGASTRIVGDERRVSLSTDEVARLSHRLSEVDVAEEMRSVDGVLLGVLPEAREFELKTPGDESETIKGKISDDLALKYTVDAAFKERLLLRPVRAQINFITTSRKSRIVRERRVLEVLEPAGDDPAQP